jgi:predicted nucleotide-binding protein (sugar kinase/HSP70/actin superfamily)
MNISVPRCGSMQFMAQDFCARLGLGFVEAPAYSERTIELGVRIAPEFVCFPMKVLLGSAIEALEAGADTLVTVAGYGACRFNYFAEIERRILEREGYRFQMVVFDSPRDSLADFYRNTRAVLRETDVHFPGLVKAMSLAVRKGWGCDEITKYAMAVRALEADKGATDRAVAESRDILAEAWNKAEIEEARRAIKERFERVPVDRERPHIRVGITGEIMMCMEPYFNCDIESWLARKGAVIERSLYMSDLFTVMGRNPVAGRDDDEIGRTAAPYLCHEIGGHGQINVAAAVDFARRGFDAVLHFFPFTCLPEIIAKMVFTRVSGELDVPILSISIDEQTGRAGMQTRLEALIDLAWSKHRSRGQAPSTSTSTSPRLSVAEV